jgi:hypothetical protein
MNFLPSKENLKKYLFEIVVIFIGITLGFLFDEWRNSRTDVRERIELKQSMRTELVRIKSFFLAEDSSIQDQLTQVNDFLSAINSDTSALFFFQNLTRDVSYLQGTFSHINALARSNASRIATNVIIARNLSFLGNMENDLARIKNDARRIIFDSIWPLMVNYRMDQDIYTLSTQDSIVLTADYKLLIHDHMTDSHLRLLTIKLNSLSGVNKSIVKRIDEILRELDRSTPM